MTSWAKCKKATLLPICAADPFCFLGLTSFTGQGNLISLPNAGNDLCKIKNAKLTLIVLWCLFASLLAIMWSMFVALRYWQAKRVNGPVDSNNGH